MLPLFLLSLSCFLGMSSPLPPNSGAKQSIIDVELTTASAIRDILLGNSIIDDVLDDFEPSYYIDLTYSQFHEPVMLGNDIPVKAASKRPAFSFHSIAPPKEDINLTFTLILTDPDATSRDNPILSEMCHWILTNLTTSTPSHWTTQKLKDGELESYYPPAPPEKTGKHRYVFVLLEGDTSKIKVPRERAHWGYGKIRHGVRDWAKDNDLKVVGANFFFAQHKKQ
jgi:phosphatidylethanolamine-binding protein